MATMWWRVTGAAKITRPNHSWGSRDHEGMTSVDEACPTEAQAEGGEASKQWVGK